MTTNPEAPAAGARARPLGRAGRAGDWLRALPGAVRRLTGWRRALAALAAGAAGALAMAPFHVLPALAVSFTILVWLLDGVPSGRAGLWQSARTGFVFGLGYFLAGLYWVGFAFLVHAETFAWMMPLGVVILPAGMAAYWGMAAAAAKTLWRPGAERILLLAVCFGAGEWLRGHALTGFPWNLAAYAWLDVLAVAQTASLIGAYGLTFLTVLAAASPAALADPPRTVGRRGWIRRAALPLACLAGIALALAGGALRLTAPRDAVPDVRVRIVQPSIPQAVKWDASHRTEFWNRLLGLTATKADDPPTHVIWAEAAMPVPLVGSNQAVPDLAFVLPEGAALISGALRFPERRSGILYNSMFAFGPKGKVIDFYDKHHLVPFGEYVPFAHLLSYAGLREIAQQFGSMRAGPGLRTMSVPGAPAFGPLICYEAIFPGHVVARDARPGWLINITDDAWYGDTPGPRQHFALARMRAIEEGLPVARAGNNGVSGMIDAYGRVWDRLRLNEVGVIDSPLPKALPPTLYARLDDLPFWLLIGGSLLWLERRRAMRAMRAFNAG